MQQVHTFMQAEEAMRMQLADQARLHQAKLELEALKHRKAVKQLRVEFETTLQSKAIRTKAKKVEMQQMRDELAALRQHLRKEQEECDALATRADAAEGQAVALMEEVHSLAAHADASEASRTREACAYSVDVERLSREHELATEEESSAHEQALKAMRIEMGGHIRACAQRHKQKQEQMKQSMRAKLDKLLEVKDSECALKMAKLEQELQRFQASNVKQAPVLEATSPTEPEACESTEATQEEPSRKRVGCCVSDIPADFEVLDEKQAAVAKYARRLRGAEKRHPTAFAVTKAGRSAVTDVLKNVSDVRSLAHRMHGRVLIRQGHPYALEIPDACEGAVRYTVREKAKAKRGDSRRNSLNKSKDGSHRLIREGVQSVMSDQDP